MKKSYPDDEVNTDRCPKCGIALDFSDNFVNVNVNLRLSHRVLYYEQVFFKSNLKKYLFNDEDKRDNQNLATRFFDISRIKFSDNKLNVTNTLYDIWKNEYELFNNDRRVFVNFENNPAEDDCDSEMECSSNSESSVKRPKLSR